MAKEIDPFLECAREFVEEKKIFLVYDAFKKIKETHQFMVENLQKQKQESGDWKLINFGPAFIDLYQGN